MRCKQLLVTSCRTLTEIACVCVCVCVGGGGVAGTLTCMSMSGCGMTHYR